MKQDLLIYPWKNLDKKVARIFSAFLPKIKPGERILLKPNLVAPRTSEEGVTTSLELVDALISFLKEKKAKVIVGEGAGYEFSSLVYEILGIKKLCAKHGVDFVDFRETSDFVEKDGLVLPKIIFEQDMIINLPKPKSHMITGYSGAMKNLFGILPLSQRRKLHIRGLAKGIYQLSKTVPVALNIVDWSTTMVGTGPTFGDTAKIGRLLASDEIYLLDHFCCQKMGIDPRSVGHIAMAIKENKVKKPKSKKSFSFKVPQSIIKANKVYRLSYGLIYLLDSIVGRVAKFSLIKFLIPRLGTRPSINKTKFNHLSQKEKQKLVAICPVGAINLSGKIDRFKCGPVRCMRCLNKFGHLIKIKGISKPSDKNG